MTVIKKIISVLLSFSLMLLTIAICLLSILPTFITPSTYLQAMEQAKVYQSIQENIQNGLDDIMLFNNIDRQTLREFISVEEVKEVVIGDVYALLAWLEGSSQKIEALDLSSYETRFDERMAAFFSENQYYLDEAAKADVELMKQDAMQIMKGNLRLLDFDQITNMSELQQVMKSLEALNFKSLAAGLVGLVMLIVGLQVLLSPRSRRQQKRKKYEIGLLYSGYGIVAGGLFIFIVFFSGIQSGFYHHIAIQVSYLRESISYLIAHTFKTLSILGLLSAGIGFMFMIPYWQRLYKKCMAS